MYNSIHFCRVTTNMTKEFCSHCGNQTLQKVSMTVNDDGTICYCLSRRKPISTRGLKVSYHIFYVHVFCLWISHVDMCLSWCRGECWVWSRYLALRVWRFNHQAMEPALTWRGKGFDIESDLPSPPLASPVFTI